MEGRATAGGGEDQVGPGPKGGTEETGVLDRGNRGCRGFGRGGQNSQPLGRNRPVIGDQSAGNDQNVRGGQSVR